MFQYLESRIEIARAQEMLEKTIGQEFRKKMTKSIGYPGGTIRNANVLTDGVYWFWTKHRRSADTPRKLNWFGVLGEERHGVSITVEINAAYTGRNDQAGGFFAREVDTGRVYLLHSGRVGGGTKGVGKEAFLAYATSKGYELVEAIDSVGDIRHGLIVMQVEGRGATQSALRYVSLVRAFKIAARDGTLITKKFQRRFKEFSKFYREARGRRKGQRKGEFDYISRHGDIVDALHDWRSSKPKPSRSEIVKNVYFDLGLGVGKKLIEVFEVKSSADRQVIYAALGQLMVHGSDKSCRRVIVLPEGPVLSGDLADALNTHRIELMRFRIRKNSVTIL
jgi:hypothetical protein